MLKELTSSFNITFEKYLNAARNLLSGPLNEDAGGFLGDANFVFRYREDINYFMDVKKMINYQRCLRLKMEISVG